MSDEDKQPSLEPPKLFGRRKKDVPADFEPEASDAPEADLPEPEPEPEPEPIPEPEPTRATRASLPEDRAPAAEDPPVARTLLTGAPLFADEVEVVEEPSDEEVAADLAEDDWDSEDSESDEDYDDEATAGRRPKSRRVPRGPVLTGYPASALTGLLVGALMVGLTVAALRGCEAIRDTSTCGGPGLLILVIILVVLVMVGQLLLKAFRVPDPGSTSFLAVGLIAVVALLFLIDVILDWQMLIVIPLVGLLTFLLSHWVTTAFVETADH
jgi:hypothetical protein